MLESLRAKWTASLVGLLVLGHSLPARAATATANLTVTATVVSSCSITSGTLAFGNYDPTATSNVDATATFQVTCTKGTAVTVGLNLGGNASGSTRRMANGTEFLTYEVYQESGRTTVWGNSGASLLSLGAAASNAAQTMTVHGRLPQGQNVSVGSFADTVLMTVTF